MRRYKKILHGAKLYALDIFFPPRCPLCGELMPVGSRVHGSCLAALPRIRTARCGLCGKPVAEGEPFCADCRSRRHFFDAGIGAFVYEGALRDALLAMKFRGRKEYAEAIGALMAEEAAAFLREHPADLVLDVPMHPAKIRKRGFDQAAALAASFAYYADLPYGRGVLVRTRATGAMKDLPLQERIRNLTGAFSVRKKESVRGKAVVLVDDIYTTGTTMDAAAAALRASGARRIYFVTAATGDDR